MGEMAEYYMEQDCSADVWPDEQLSADPPRRVTRLSKWRTRSGQEIAVRDLQTDHLQNILKMHSQGRLQMPDAWVLSLEREMRRRK